MLRKYLPSTIRPEKRSFVVLNSMDQEIRIIQSLMADTWLMYERLKNANLQ